MPKVVNNTLYSPFNDGSWKVQKVCFFNNKPYTPFDDCNFLCQNFEFSKGYLKSLTLHFTPPLIIAV